MKILVLGEQDVERLLPMNECIDVMESALIGLERGEAFQPLRTAMVPRGAKGVLGLMPSFRFGDVSLYGLKAVTVTPGNPAIGKDSHQGGVMLFSGDTGELLAVMNASAITAIRTAAVSAVATRLLARPEAADLAIIGAGVQARTNLEAMSCVRKLNRVRVSARSLESATRFATEMSLHYYFPIEPVATAREAVTGADLIVTATSAPEPVVKREWIAEGAHLNVVGSSIRTDREVDSQTMAASSLFVDRRESTLNEAGDYLLALKEGAITADHIRAEIGELLTGAHSGRTSPSEITLFKSLGIGIEDLASAWHMYQKAEATQEGAWVEF